MELNTSHYFPLDNLTAILQLIDMEKYEIRAGIILQVVPKHNAN